MTWASHLSRSLSLLIVLPLILHNFSAEEISLWYLLSTVVALQSLVDMGFAPTFARSIAYAVGGASKLEDFSNSSHIESLGSTNWALLERICSTMKVIYFRLGLMYSIALTMIGTAFLYHPISLLQNPSEGWTAWAIVIASSAITFWNAAYTSYLQGVNEISRFRRWETLVILLSIFSNFSVLLFNGNLWMLVLSSQVWSLVGTWVYYRLCCDVLDKRFQSFETKGIDKPVFEVVWRGAWRSGVGMAMSQGVVQLTGIFYAQVGNVKEVASYLFSLRFAQTITYFSQAPFYTKLPILASMRSGGKIVELLQIARRGMSLSYIVYALGFCITGLTVYPALSMIQSNVEFVQPDFWSLLAWAFFTERFGAMHLQLYTISNNVIWHIANGISGLLNIGFMIVLFQYAGVYAFPLSMLLSNLLFYSWYTARFSYKEYPRNFFSFERETSAIAFAVLSVYTLYVFVKY